MKPKTQKQEIRQMFQAIYFLIFGLLMFLFLSETNSIIISISSFIVGIVCMILSVINARRFL